MFEYETFKHSDGAGGMTECILDTEILSQSHRWYKMYIVILNKIDPYLDTENKVITSNNHRLAP